MSHAQLQQEIANALALAGQDWTQGSTALNTAFAKLLNTLNNMGGQLLTMQNQATATAQTAKAWQAENHLTMPTNTDKPVCAVLSRLEGPKARSFARTRLEILNSGTAYTWARMCGELEELFRPANQKDWAQKKLRELKQGRMTIDEWIIKFQTYSQAAQLDQ